MLFTPTPRLKVVFLMPTATESRAYTLSRSRAIVEESRAATMRIHPEMDDKEIAADGDAARDIVRFDPQGALEPAENTAVLAEKPLTVQHDVRLKLDELTVACTHVRQGDNVTHKS